MKFKVTPIMYSVHSDVDNPIYGDSCVHVRIEDDAAGPFICMKSLGSTEHEANGELTMEFEQFDAVCEAVAKLRSA